MSTVLKTYVTPEQYLERERAALEKSEYYDGEIFAMGGASLPHNLIVANLVGELRAQLKGRRCVAYPSDLRVAVGPKTLFTYPDVSVVCGEARVHDAHRDMVINPRVIVEVLSPSTQAYDRGPKFALYQQLESLTDYLLVSSVEARVEHFSRQEDGHWLLSGTVGRDGLIPIPSIGCELLMTEVYDRVVFEREEMSDRPQ